MADYTIHHKVSEEKTSQRGGARPTSQKIIDESKIAKEISRALEKTYSSLGKNVSAELNKVITTALTRVLEKALRGKDTKSGYITQNDIKRIASAVATDTANSVVRAVSKNYKPNKPASSDTKAIEAFLRNSDKQTAAAIGKLNSSLQRLGVELSPEATRSLENALNSAIRRAIPTQVGTGIKESQRAAEALKNSANIIERAVKRMESLGKSGGGISAGEISKVLKDLGAISKEASELSGEMKVLADSVKKVAGAATDTVREMKNSVKEFKSSISKKVSEVSKAPVEARGPNTEKLVDAFKQATEKLITATKKEATPKRDKSTDDLTKAVKENTRTTEKLQRSIEKKEDPKAASGKMDDASVQKILKGINDIALRVVKTRVEELRKYADSPVADVELHLKLDKEVSDFMALIKNKKILELKDAAGRGLTGGPDTTTDKDMEKIRSAIVALENKLGRENLESAFKNYSDNITTKLDDVIKAVKEKPKEQQPFRQQDTYKPTYRTRPPIDEGAAKQSKELARNIELINSKIRGPANVGRFPEMAIEPTTRGITLEAEGSYKYGKAFDKYKKITENRVNELATSLKDLQDYIVKTLDEEFKEAGKGWQVVRESANQSVQDFFKLVQVGNAKQAGKQFSFEIADIEGIRKSLTGRGVTPRGATSGAIVNQLKTALVDEYLNKYSANLVDKIAEWLKTVSVEQIEQIEALEPVKGKLTAAKKYEGEGVVPSAEFIKALKTNLGQDRAVIEAVFRETFGKMEAERTLRDEKLIRSISLPAARISKTGTTVFETARGSQRALPQFAVFKTGFERLYEGLERLSALDYGKGYAERIREVGIKPTSLNLDKAEKLAKEMLQDFVALGQSSETLAMAVRDAAKIRGNLLTDKAAGQKLQEDVEKALSIPDIQKNAQGFLQALEQAGVSAYDVVKQLDAIKFENVYDVMRKVLEGAKSGTEPLKKLGKSPQFERSIREYEGAINQLVQTLPLIEAGRPRRGMHQENVLNLLTRTGGPYAGEKPLAPPKQQEFIKDLNVRLQEMLREAEITNRQVLKEGMRTVSSLGIPEAQAGKVEFYRPGLRQDAGTKYLAELDAVVTKMSTEALPELAPFGAQFTQLGRNIANVTNAMSSSAKEIDDLQKRFGSQKTIMGYGTEFPALRTSRERDIIEAGRYGEKGYGFNVLTELRHTAGTMEDQVLVSGRLADAMTSVVKNLVAPGTGGRIRAGAEGAQLGVSKVATGDITEVGMRKDTDEEIKKTFRQFQEVLGVPKVYEGRADKAFIDEVKKTLTVIRGQEVEVQQARLTEVFLNYFGRKFTTRYGSKGVSVTPAGLTDESAKAVVSALQKFPEASVKVLTKAEREKAGLGVAIMPRSGGELLSELFKQFEDTLINEGMLKADVGKLRRNLEESGNKFIVDLFRDAKSGITVPEEAMEQKKLFKEASAAFEAITGQALSPEVKKAIDQIRTTYKGGVGGPLKKERPIDIRISSAGIGKRGLQPEFLEAIVNNIVAAGPRGTTTLPTTFSKEQYTELLGRKGPGGKLERGRLSEISAALGYETAGPTEDLIKELKQRFMLAGKKEDMAEVMAKRAAALEEVSNYYTTIIDEFGKQRKSIVGEKFLEIIEEPTENPPWKASDIKRGLKGVKVDIPVFSAYASIFGEQSALIEEIKSGAAIDQKKHWEFLKAMQFMNEQSKELQMRMREYLDQVDLEAVGYFDEATGVMGEATDAMDPRNMAGTIFDISKFPKPFVVDIPSATGKPGEREPFYVPGAAARGTYPEELIAGERGMENIARRLQHVINMAKEADELLARPAALQADIEALNMQLEQALETGSEDASKLEAQLQKKMAQQERILSGEGLVAKTIRSKSLEKIGELTREAYKLRGQTSQEALDRVQQIFETLRSVVSSVEEPAEAFKVKRVGLPSGASELQNVDAFFQKQSKVTQERGQPMVNAYIDAIGKASDILIGKSDQAKDFYNQLQKGIAEIQTGETVDTSDTLRKLSESLGREPRFKGKPLLEAMQEKLKLIEPGIKASEEKLYRVEKAIRSETGEGFQLAAKLGLDVEQELQFRYLKKLDDLQKAKIDYYNALAESAVGKTGSVATTLFSRQIPGLMQKATVAIVDRTEELNMFKESLGKILGSDELSELTDLSGLEEAIKGVSKITAEHQSKIATQLRAGLPVLKQEELGITPQAAKKLPVKFKKAFRFEDREGGGLRLARDEQAEDIEGTLYDLLAYVEELEEAMTGTLTTKGGKKIDVQRTVQPGDIRDFIEKELAPYVESIRYPFTGLSSVVPYRAKLLKGPTAQKAQGAFAVPGIPDLDLTALNKSFEQVGKVIEDLAAKREEEQSKLAPDFEKIEKFTMLIDKLSAAVSETIPKYQAHTAKLDFDGDTIEVHTAATREAREEIRKHYKSITDFDYGKEVGQQIGKTTQGVYRDFFTSQAALSQQATGTSVLGEAGEAFYKKFEPTKGVEFLRRPFLTQQLEYLPRGEKLSVLGGATGSMTQAIEDIITDTVRGVDAEGKEFKDKFIEVVRSVSDQFGEISGDDVEQRIKFGEAVLNSIEMMDKEIGNKFSKEIESVLTSRLFESRFKDAVIAQLFKIHTGQEVESVYRLGAVAQSNIGFGGGIIGGGRGFQPSAGFRQRQPEGLQILGGMPEFDAQTYINEVMRFAQQKGMDVKHAGAKPVAGEIVAGVSKGLKGVEELWEKILSEGDYGELAEFNESTTKAIAMRLGEIPTEQIRKELGTLYKARGAEFDAAKLARAKRPELMEMATEAVGLKGYLQELAIEIREAAFEGIVSELQSLTPAERSKRGVKGDVESYARKLIQTEMADQGINIRQHVTLPKFPLYGFRSETNLGRQLSTAIGRGEDIDTSNVKFFKKSAEEQDELVKKYRQAQATAINIQEALMEAAESQGAGGYNELVKSAIDNLYKEQQRIESEVEKLRAEGYDPGQVGRSLQDLGQRTLTGEGLPEITKKILALDPKKRQEMLEEYANLAGLPSMGREETFQIRKELGSTFRQFGTEQLAARYPEAKTEDLATKADDFQENMLQKAETIYEMDRILDALITKANEGVVLTNIFGGRSGKTKAATGAKSFQFAKRMGEIAEEGAARRSYTGVLAQGPAGGGMGGIPGMPTGGMGGGNVVPVYVVGMAQNLIKGGAFTTATSSAPMEEMPQKAAMDDTIRTLYENLGELKKYGAEFDRHGEEGIDALKRRLEKFKKATSGFDRHEGRFDVEEYRRMKKEEFFSPLVDTPGGKPPVFTGSSFKSGGLRGPMGAKMFTTGGRLQSQVEAMMRKMLGLDDEDIDEYTEVAFALGTALHAKIQDKLKREFGQMVDIEKLVTFEPEQISGAITGFIDAAFRDQLDPEKIKKVLDIKTTSESGTSFKKIQELVPEGGIKFQDLIEKEGIPTSLRQSLEDYRSQINVYLAGLKAMGEAAEDISGQIDYYASEDINLSGDPKSIFIDFDPKRLEEDLQSLNKARELVREAILNNMPAEEFGEYADTIKRIKAQVSKKGLKVKKGRDPKSLQLEERLDQEFGVLDLPQSMVDEYLKTAFDAWKVVNKKAAEKAAMQAKETAEAAAGAMGAAQTSERGRGFVPNVDPTKYAGGQTAQPRLDERVLPKGQDLSPLESQFENLKALHEQSVLFQTMYKKLNFRATLEEMHDDIKAALGGPKPMGGAEFNELISSLRESGEINYQQFIKGWKLYRIAMGNFLIQRADEMKGAFEVAQQMAAQGKGSATKDYENFFDSVRRLREFVDRSAGKRTDIYTANRRFIFPDFAKAAGVYKDEQQLLAASQDVFGEDETIRKIFERIVQQIEGERTGGAPIQIAREAADELANLDKELVMTLESAEMMKRVGKGIREAWDFTELSRGARRLREALQSYSRENLTEGFDVEKRFQVQNIAKYLQQIERAYAPITGPEGPVGSTVPVPKFLPEIQQRALHGRNLERIRERLRMPEEEGGFEVGKQVSYFAKVVDESGMAIDNVLVNFRKYGETIDSTGMKIGQFTEGHRDLIDKLQTAGATFRGALRRVVMWGSAATLVYGGVQKLKESISDLAAIELGLAQLRMVMSPLETDFEMLEKAAVEFAKNYGVSVENVIQSMKVFAQQGLTQAEVMDRAKVSTLAANVTTLNAVDATEALTAAMKVFRNEGDSAMRFLDAWSETEAKHAITAGDMANAIKKAASAAKNAGFTFDELNGIVAAIGAVTRQTGKEIGTSIRFIVRRLGSEEGPKALAKLGIPVQESGQLRAGYDILSDLADAWKDLTNAQKLATAQAIGGTRQYNSLLVLMDNWDEALSAVADSTNSKGSAERRNLEIMKTYAKQLEQTKAAATELQMELGKIVFPVFKTGLRTMKLLLETITNIPTPIKAAAAGLTLFFGYAAKGTAIVDNLVEIFSRGKAAISNFAGEVGKQFDIAGYEVFGRKGMEDITGLKTIFEAKNLDQIRSPFGKLAYITKSAADTYNSFIFGMADDTAKATMSIGETIDTLGKKFESFGDKLQKGSLVATGIGALTPIAGDETIAAILSGVGTGIEYGGKGAQKVGEFTQYIGETFGKGAQAAVEAFAKQNENLAVTLLPLAVTMAAAATASTSLYRGYKRLAGTAQDFEKAMYPLQRLQESQLSTIRSLGNQYEMASRKIEDVNDVIADPGLKTRRQEYDNYTDPLIALGKIQEDLISTTNSLAETSTSLIAGYDNLGNAILKTSANFKSYMKTLEEIKVREMALTEVDIAAKFVSDLTETGGMEKFKEELKKLAEEVPVIGELIAKGISVSPARALETLTTRLNELINLRNKYSLTTAFDEDIKQYQEGLKSVRKTFMATYSDFRKSLSEISTAGLGRDTISEILGDERLMPGYELMLEVEPRIQFLQRRRAGRDISVDQLLEAAGVSQVMDPKRYRDLGKELSQIINEGVAVGAKDVLGAEVLKKVFPSKAPFIDVAGELTAGRLETAGIMERQGKAMAGDIVTFIPELAKAFDIAGNQAIVELKKNIDGTFDWFVTYFNSKSLKIEERPFDEDVMKMVDAIFPVQRIQEDMEERLKSLNEFVAGAAAGLRGISPTDFKRDFNLGERFYGDIATTTLLQSNRGFNPVTGGFGQSPFQQQWRETMDEFFFKPMTDYRLKLEQLTKLTLEGLDPKDITISRDLYEELGRLQDILKNNQVVVQYRAVFADLTKTIEAGTASMRDNIAVEEDRMRLMGNVSGLMRGIVSDLESVDLGARRATDLTARQRLLRNDRGFRTGVEQLRIGQLRREGQFENVAATTRALNAIDRIREVSTGFGATLSPDQLKNYVETIARTGDEGIAELKVETSKVAQNTADTVAKLDDILANMGDPGAIERVIEQTNSFIAGGITQTSRAIASLGKLERLRGRALEEGDQTAVAQLNEAMTRVSRGLVRNLGIEEAMSAVESRAGLTGFTPDDFRKALISGMDTESFISSLSDTGKEIRVGLFDVLKPFKTRDELRRTLRGDRPAFEGSKELARLRKLQEEDGKRSLISDKSILKAQAALATYQLFDRRNSTKILESLQNQEKQLRQRSEAGEEGLDKERASVMEAIRKEQESIDFKNMALAITLISGSTMQLAKAFGLAEKDIKALGAGAIATYGAMQLVTKITGKDLPESAREFGDTLKQAAKEYAAEGEVGLITGAKVKSAGRAFQKQYGERFSEAFGTSPEKLKEELDKTIAESGVEGLDEQEIRKRASELRKATSKAEGTNKALQVSISTLAAILTGYANEQLAPGTRAATLEKRAKQQQDVINDIITKYPEEFDKILQTTLQQTEKSAEKATAEVDTKSLVLDTEQELQKVRDSINTVRDGLVEPLEDLNEEMSGLADKLAIKEMVEELRKQLDDARLSLVQSLSETDVQRRFGGPGILNRSLIGFPEDVRLPIDRREMGTQQRFFSQLGDTMSSSNILSRIMPNDMAERAKEIQTAFADYAQTLTTVDGLVSRLSTLESERYRMIADELEDTSAYEELERQIEDAKDSIKELSSEARKFAMAASNLFKFTEAVDMLNDSLRDIAAQEAVEGLRGFRKYRDELDKLMGGGHPLARQFVTPEQEYEAARVGVRLRSGESTRFDIERANLMNRLREAEGPEATDIRRQLANLPELQRREIERYEQSREDENLRRQLTPFEDMLNELERLRTSPGLSGEQIDEIRSLQETITSALERSTERVSMQQLLSELAGTPGLSRDVREAEARRIMAAGERQYRGVDIGASREITEAITNIREGLEEQLPTGDIAEMKSAVTEPLLEELRKQTGFLSKLAGGDVLERGFIERIRDYLSPMKLFDSEDYQRKASGGRIFGEGGPKQDKVPAYLSPGEYVIKQASAAKIGYANLEKMNANGTLPRMMASGGIVDWIKDRLKTAKDFWFGEDAEKAFGGKRFGEGREGTTGYLKPGVKTLKELEDMGLGPKGMAEGGIVDWIKKRLEIAKDFWFGKDAEKAFGGKRRFGEGQEGTSGYLKPKYKTLQELEERELGMGGMIRKYQEGGKSEEDKMNLTEKAQERMNKVKELFEKVTGRPVETESALKSMRRGLPSEQKEKQSDPLKKVKEQMEKAKEAVVPTTTPPAGTVIPEDKRLQYVVDNDILTKFGIDAYTKFMKDGIPPKAKGMGGMSRKPRYAEGGIMDYLRTAKEFYFGKGNRMAQGQEGTTGYLKPSAKVYQEHYEKGLISKEEYEELMRGLVPQKAMGGKIRKYAEGGVFETASKFWGEVIDNFTEKRMQLVDEYTDTLTQASEGKYDYTKVKPNTVENILQQAGINALDIGTRFMKGLFIDLPMMLESKTEDVFDAASMAGGFGNLGRIGVNQLITSAKDIGQFGKYLASGFRSGEAFRTSAAGIKSAMEFLSGVDYKAVGEGLKGSIYEGLRSGEAVTGGAALGLAVATPGALKELSKVNQVVRTASGRAVIFDPGSPTELTAAKINTSIKTMVDTVKDNLGLAEAGTLKLAESTAKITSKSPGLKGKLGAMVRNYPRVGRPRLKARGSTGRFFHGSKSVYDDIDPEKYGRRLPGQRRLEDEVDFHNLPIGAYFSKDPRYASGYAGLGEGANVRAVELGLKNPVDPAVILKKKDITNLSNIAPDLDFSKSVQWHDALNVLQDAYGKSKLTGILKRLGFDGAVYKEGGSKAAVAFNKSQIIPTFQSGGMVRRKYQEGGIVDWLLERLKVAKDFWFGEDAEKAFGGQRFGAGREGTSGYLKPGAKTLQELKDMELCGGGKIKKYAEGGAVARKFTVINGKLVEVDEAGNIIKTLSDDPSSMNRAYMEGVGEVPFKSPKGKPAMLGVRTAVPTQRRFIEQINNEFNKMMTDSSARSKANRSTKFAGRLGKEPMSIMRFPGQVAKAGVGVGPSDGVDVASMEEVRRILAERGSKAKVDVRYNVQSFDRRRSLVGLDTFSTAMQPYYDLNELNVPFHKVGLDSKPKGTITRGTRDRGIEKLSELRDMMSGQLDRYDSRYLKELRERAGVMPETEAAKIAGIRFLPKKAGPGDPEAQKELEKYREFKRRYNLVNAMIESGRIQDPFEAERGAMGLGEGARSRQEQKAADLRAIYAGMAGRGPLVEGFETTKRDLERAQYGFDPRLAFRNSPETFMAYKEALKAGDKEKAAKLKQLLETTMGPATDEQMAKAVGEYTDLSKKLRATYTGAEKTTNLIDVIKSLIGSKDSAGLIDRQTEAQFKRELEKFSDLTSYVGNRSMPVMHNGGTVAQTGPVFAQGGEVILPKGFAEGGMVGGGVAAEALKSGSIKLEADEAAQKIEAAISKALADVSLKVDDNARVKVDVSDAKVPVDVSDAKVGVDIGTTKVPVDTENATININADSLNLGDLGESVKRAVESANINVNVNGSVGADRNDELAQALDRINSRLDTAEGGIDEVRTEIVELDNNVVKKSEVTFTVQGAVQSALSRIDQDVQENRRDIDLMQSRQRTIDNRISYQLEENRRSAAQANDFGHTAHQKI